MTDHSDHLPPSDVCLLLRTHAQQHWLNREVVPLLQELELDEPLDEEERATALVYLEVLWIEACRRAIETDAAYDELRAPDATEGALNGQARDYRTAVRALHEALAERVAQLIVGDEERLIGDPAAGALAHDRAQRQAHCIRCDPWRPGSTSSRTRSTQTAR